VTVERLPFLGQWGGSLP